MNVNLAKFMAYLEIHRMHHGGHSIFRISGHLEFNRPTVSNYLSVNEQEYEAFLIASQNRIKFYILLRAP